MQKYQSIKKLGSGSFGNVELAENKQTREIVAIKQLKKKYGTWDECLQMSEVKALRKMVHPNIIKLKEMIRIGNDAHLVFEYIEKDLFKLIEERREKGKVLSDFEIRHISKQIAEALSYIHKQGYFHRDLKPENLLIDEDFNLKLIDFGIAKQIRSKPPFTEYCSTRWYRAPELLLRFSAYSAPVDVFAVGCIIAEMYLMKPLFLGNSQIDQLNKITSVLGTPKSWSEGLKQAVKKGIHFPQYSAIDLQTIITNCPADGIDFINECLKWQPSKRITATQMLDHPFIKKIEQKKMMQKTSEIKRAQNASKFIKPSGSSNKTQWEKAGSKQFSYNALEHDEIFEQLLNNFEQFNIKDKGLDKKAELQSKNKPKREDQDEWN